MSNNTNLLVNNKSRVRDMVETAMLIALVFISTYFLQFKLPVSINGGLIHLGNTMLFTASILFGARKGAAAGAFGMGLFDIASGWTAWAPFTFIIRGAMGYIIGKFANIGGRKGGSPVYNFLGILVASMVMLPGYYLAEVILYGNWQSPMTSIPGNLTQLAFGLIVSLPLTAALKKTNKF